MMVDNVEAVDEDGDVVLIIGPHEKRLKVASATLSKASSVFKALFGPYFREGQAKRTSTKPAEISLPDDDPWAMVWICAQLHMVKATDEGSSAVYSPFILKLALLVDKYDLVGVLRLQVQAVLLRWILDSRKSCTIEAASNIIAASYLSHQARAFQMITIVFVERRFSNPSQLLQQQSGKLYPTSVLLALEERKACGYIPQKGLCLHCARDGADISTPCTKHALFNAFY
ncbi:hypothetical protein HII31_01052 [Pseudocercospora fuligena]|uniref:BTB domain-containing protein n=1 Tax=Pseudocercospora fuligena TaxID=685502 RepID=A0A8H6VR67_9PEZI|nr:hypothetical protein HII31_01052 [Pseudocercospora fuligena]